MKLLLIAAVTCVLILHPCDAKKPPALNKYTKSRIGCPCWWDLTKKKSCACCNPNGIQCGFPKHRQCQSKRNRNRGCTGIPKAKYTLSTKGYACFWDSERRNDCAWCAFGGYQCEGGMKTGPESTLGNHCFNGKSTKYCDSVIGDCRHIPTSCDPNASCVPDRPFAKTMLYKCQCNSGYTGNGVQCFDADGNLSPNPLEQVDLDINLKSEFYVHPHVEGQFNDTVTIQQLKKAMEKVECKGGECSITYNP